MSYRLAEAIADFSRKLRRFSEAERAERVHVPSKDEEIQSVIRETDVRMKSGVVSTYRLYKAPFEALGENSERAKSIDRDEQSLLKAYNLYSACRDSDSEMRENLPETFIRGVDIASPLTEKAGYTQGGQFVYLAAWLFFEQGCRKYMPLMKEQNGRFSLCFAEPEDFAFSGNDKTIFNFIEAEFYS